MSISKYPKHQNSEVQNFKSKPNLKAKEKSSKSCYFQKGNKV